MKDEEYQKVELEKMIDMEENKSCADCGARGPRWCSVNLGVFVCIRCSGIHRKMGTHISKVRSITLDKWTREQVDQFKKIGNARAKRLYEHNLPDHARPITSDDYDMEQFIRDKYERKKWFRRKGDVSQKSEQKQPSHQVSTPNHVQNNQQPTQRSQSTPQVPQQESIFTFLAQTNTPQSTPVNNTNPLLFQPQQQPQQTNPLLFQPQQQPQQNNLLFQPQQQPQQTNPLLFQPQQQPQQTNPLLFQPQQQPQQNNLLFQPQQQQQNSISKDQLLSLYAKPITPQPTQTLLSPINPQQQPNYNVRVGTNVPLNVNYNPVVPNNFVTTGNILGTGNQTVYYNPNLGFNPNQGNFGGFRN